jgi:tRNA A37 threonylcarbamoyladenosine modification protein TsaB
MNKIIIDATSESIFLVLINNSNIYNISHKNSKTNYEKLMLLVNNFLSSKNMKIKDISTIYVNRGPGSFAGIRNSLSTVKAIHLSTKIDYYCYSFQDFKEIKGIKYENIPILCNKFEIKKNLINPIYIS